MVVMGTRMLITGLRWIQHNNMLMKVGGLTLDQGVMEKVGLPIGTLVNMCDAVAVGPPPFLARRGLRRGCGCLQRLHARCEILDRIA